MTGWGETDLADSIFGYHSIPLFHAMGLKGAMDAVSSSISQTT